MRAHRETTKATCHKHGVEYEQVVIGSVAAGCPACEDERAEVFRRRDRERAEEEAQTLWEAKLERAGIPKRFRSKTLDAYEAQSPDQARALEVARDYAAGFEQARQNGRSCLFVGKPGTGKTHLAVGIALHVLEHGGSVWFGTVQRAVRRIKSTWAKGSTESEEQAMRAFTQPDLLVLDEVGVQFGSEFEQNLLFDILNERYEHVRPTVLCSNLAVERVKELLGERVLDRFREDSGKVVLFDWPSYRAGGAS